MGDSSGSAGDERLKKILEDAHQRTGVSPGMQQIEHVVVLMLENRGFDHFMGLLYNPDEFESLNHVPCVPKQRKELLQLKLKDQGKDPHEDLHLFEGLSALGEQELKARANSYDFSIYPFKVIDEYGHDDPRGTFELRKGARAANVPRANSHEDFIHIFEDMYYGTSGGKPDLTSGKLHAKMKKRDDRNKLIKNDNGQYLVPGMKGFVQNFGDAIAHHLETKKVSKTLLSEILDMYTPDQLPVLSFLARHYALSDLWFCSVPSQTNTNRAFWAAGTARGLVTNNFYEPFPNLPIETHSDKLPADSGRKVCRSMFDVLEERSVSWKYYWSMNYPVGSNLYFSVMFPQFADAKYKRNLPDIKQFFADAQSGQLPAVSYIEPLWGGGPAWSFSDHYKHQKIPRAVGNEFHPVADTTCGEFFVKKVYEAVSQGPAWNKTLLVITFDENGGTYDHLPPWPARPTGRDHAPRINQGKHSKVRMRLEDKYASEWEKPAAAAAIAGGASATASDADGSQFGFGFDVYGVRVPTLLISPLIKPRTIFRSPTEVPFDHTSVISTILKWKGIEPATAGLGERVAYAPSFDGVLQGNGEGDASGARFRDHPVLGVAPSRRSPKDDQEPLRYGEKVHLRYVGNWASADTAFSGERAYLGGPPAPLTRLGGWLYPIFTTREHALDLTLLNSAGGSETLGNGQLVQLEYDHDEKPYRVGVPSSKLNPNLIADTVWLNSAKGGDDGTLWRVWLAADRINGKLLYPGDLVFFFSERYDVEKVYTGMARGYDPYQKLTMEADPQDKTYVYAKFRAGEWDAWIIERISEPAPKVVLGPPPADGAPPAPAPVLEESDRIRKEVILSCQLLTASVNHSQRLRDALLAKWDGYNAALAKKGKNVLDDPHAVGLMQSALAAALVDKAPESKLKLLEKSPPAQAKEKRAQIARPALDQVLKDARKHVIPNAGGGDCLFYSLDQLLPEHPGVHKVRKEVVEHLRAMSTGNATDSGFGVAGTRGEAIKRLNELLEFHRAQWPNELAYKKPDGNDPFANYLARMALPGTEGDLIALCAASHLYGAVVTYYLMTKDGWWSDVVDFSSEKKHELWIRNKNNVHFEAIVPDTAG